MLLGSLLVQLCRSTALTLFYRQTVAFYWNLLQVFELSSLAGVSSCSKSHSLQHKNIIFVESVAKGRCWILFWSCDHRDSHPPVEKILQKRRYSKQLVFSNSLFLVEGCNHVTHSAKNKPFYSLMLSTAATQPFHLLRNGIGQIDYRNPESWILISSILCINTWWLAWWKSAAPSCWHLCSILQSQANKL